MSVSDESLARAAAEGDRDAFGQLIERVYDRVFAFAFRITGRRDEAEDLAQDICAALPVKLRSFQGKSRLSTWLYTLTLNAARDRFRRQKTYAKATNGWGDWEISRQAEMSEEAERLAWLRLAMDTLTPPELRETVLLMLEGLTHAEIAGVMGVSEGTISWRISEAKTKLKAMKGDAV
ncbi:MAG: RNA polymerase sigma factor [Pelagimonas sp.]|nr:RNA polymerase sigma factor [Pelagimonas sp.]